MLLLLELGKALRLGVDAGYLALAGGVEVCDLLAGWVFDGFLKVLVEPREQVAPARWLML